MLSLTNLRKSFGQVTAVDGLSLDIRRGEVFGLLGPNGAGKTTTISIAVGLVTPDSGSVHLDLDADDAPDAGAGSPRDPRVRRWVGIAPQALAIYDDLSADENLRFFGALYGLSGRALRARAEDVLDLVGLRERRRHRVAGFSGGMKRRLNLAAALVHRPRLLMLDEPTAGVDPQSRNSILETVRAIAAGGCTVIYTTHYMEEAQKLCDRVAIIDHGKVLALDSPRALIDRFGGESVVTILRDPDQPESVIRTAEPLVILQREMAAGPVAGVRIDRPDLESVFLGLTGRRLRD